MHAQSAHIYLKYHSVCTLVGIGTPPTLSPASECAFTLGTKGEGNTLACVRAGGGVPTQTTGEKAYYSVYSVVEQVILYKPKDFLNFCKQLPV
jgi:hypothetical protein